MKFRLAQQIEEVQYVIDHAYTALRLRKSHSDMHVARMKSVLATLRLFEAHEAGLRQWFSEQKATIASPPPEIEKASVARTAIDLLVDLGWCKPTRLFINDFQPTAKCPLGMPIVEANPRTSDEAQCLLDEFGGKLKTSKTGLYHGEMQWHVEDTQATQVMRQLVTRSIHPFKKRLAESWIERWANHAP